MHESLSGNRQQSWARNAGNTVATVAGDTTDTFLGSGKYWGGQHWRLQMGQQRPQGQGNIANRCVLQRAGGDRQYKIFGIHYHRDTRIETELQGPTNSRTVHFASASVTLNCGHKLRTTLGLFFCFLEHPTKNI